MDRHTPLEEMAWCDQVAHCDVDCHDGDLDLDEWDYLVKTYNRSESFGDVNDTSLPPHHQLLNESFTICTTGIESRAYAQVGSEGLMTNDANQQASTLFNERGMSLIQQYGPSESTGLNFSVPSMQQRFKSDAMIGPSATEFLLSPLPECSHNTPQKRIGGLGPDVCISHCQSISQHSIPIIAPLTAYNYYYRNERDTIIKGMSCADDPIPPSDMDFSPRKMNELLQHHWTVDPFRKKRQHRKTHGVIEFTELSREISKRWRMLPKHGREFYRAVAQADQQRYEAYMATRPNACSLRGT